MDSQILSCLGWFRVAVQALVILAENDGDCPSAVMARELNAHAVFLRRVMTRMVQAHIVVAREGRNGGYRLARPVESITLAEVYHAARAAYQPEEAPKQVIGNACVQHMLDEVASEIEQSLLTTLERYSIASMMEKPVPSNLPS